MEKSEKQYYDTISNEYTGMSQRPDARRKLELIDLLIPKNSKSVLDVGGANGWLTDGLRERCWVVTQEISYASLEKGKGDRILSDAANLPLADISFDAVICSQVLEHLSSTNYPLALNELSRVARETIVVSVPYREDLSMRLVECKYCGHIFNCYYHQRAFDENELSTLFSGWTMVEWHVFGELNTDSNMADVRAISRKSTYRKPPLAEHGLSCPVCGNIDKKARLQKKFLWFNNALQRRLRRLWSLAHRQKFISQQRTPYWIAAIYFRE